MEGKNHSMSQYSADNSRFAKRNPINYSQYSQYANFQTQNMSKFADAIAVKSKQKSWVYWVSQCPKAFQQAEIGSLSKYDEKASKSLDLAVERSKYAEKPVSLIVYSTPYEDNTGRIVYPKGKTWAVYSYIRALYEQNVISDPLHEVFYTSESEILDNLLQWSSKDKRSWLYDKAFDSGMKIVVVDNINGNAGRLKRKYRLDAWESFQQAAILHPEISYVFAFAGDAQDSSLAPIIAMFKTFLDPDSLIRVELKRGIETEGQE